MDPVVGAVILVNPAATHQAAESDRRRVCGRSLGALDGIPVLLKDNIDTAFLQTTAGSRALLGMPPVRDAFHRDAVASGRSSDPREGEPVGRGELPGRLRDRRLVGGRWPDQQPVRPGPEPVRFLVRSGGRRRCRAGPGGRRHRDQRSGDLSFTALKSEFVRDLERYLRTRPRQERTLQQLVDFNAADPVELSRFDQNLFLTCLAAPPASAPSIVAARTEARRLARAALDGLFTTQRLDAVMAPSNSPAWRTTYGTGDDFKIGSSGAAAVAGYPDLSVPAGYVGALPVGVNFIGARRQDVKILQIGAAFEAAARARTALRFLPSIG